MDNADSDNFDTYYDTITSMARVFLGDLKDVLDKNDKLTAVSVGNSWMSVLTELYNEAKRQNDDTFIQFTDKLHKYCADLKVSYV